MRGPSDSKTAWNTNEIKVSLMPVPLPPGWASPLPSPSPRPPLSPPRPSLPNLLPTPLSPPHLPPSLDSPPPLASGGSAGVPFGVLEFRTLTESPPGLFSRLSVKGMNFGSFANPSCRISRDGRVPICMSSYLITYLSVYLPIYLFVCLPTYLFVCLLTYQFIYLSIYQSTYLLIYQSIFPSTSSV